MLKPSDLTKAELLQVVEMLAMETGPYYMDRVLAEIISGKAELIRFPDRYPNAKKIKYGR